MINPQYWDNIITTVIEMAKHGGIDAFGIPSLLLRVGRSLSALASANRAVGIKTRDSEIDGQRC